jgi:putative transposase
MFVNVKDERYYLWRPVDHEGEVLERLVTRRSEKGTALKFARK